MFAYPKFKEESSNGGTNSGSFILNQIKSFVSISLVN